MELNLKYSKSSAFYSNTKKSFFSENDRLLQNSINQNKLYASQPYRKGCKLCNSELPQRADFCQHGVDYLFCGVCDHLNGRFDDTKDFVEKMYSSDKGSEYAVNYIDQNFNKRTQDIYIPKVDFLLENITPGAHKLLDVGCGSGYFVLASMQKEIEALGIDIGSAAVEFGNNQISQLMGKKPLVSTSESEFYNAIVDTDADIVSAIGVIEHLREPHKFFEAFKKSRAKYLYYSVPMFSFSVILENLFSDVFPRQLSGGHTHLFTEKSLRVMNAQIGVESIAEWRFGTDIIDLYRSCMTSLSKNKVSEKLMTYLSDGIGTQIDQLQAVLDKNHFCSEIHCITAKK